ncbi:MAG TPA: zinc ribbon domain-containing protein [Candidatus Binataceae bacterium]|nr:zinc ribbon domain-containing protein [Candidatus Binataceae bacterium]
MPIYEWQCEGGHLFEVLAASSATRTRPRCPDCGAKSQRMFSTVAIHSGAPLLTASERAADRGVDVANLKLPNAMRLCAMDDYSATRLAAHKLGRGHEFDDKMAARQERQVARGDVSRKAATRKSKHSHQH